MGGFYIYIQKKSFLCSARRSGLQIPTKRRKKPTMNSEIAGYSDQRHIFSIPNETQVRCSISTAKAPKAIVAPPYMYGAPPLTYRVSVTTVVTMTAVTPSVGSPNGKNHVPPVFSFIYKRRTAAAAKPQGTKMTGFGLLNQSGRIQEVYRRTRENITYPDQFS